MPSFQKLPQEVKDMIFDYTSQIPRFVQVEPIRKEIILGLGTSPPTISPARRIPPLLQVCHSFRTIALEKLIILPHRTYGGYGQGFYHFNTTIDTLLIPGLCYSLNEPLGLPCYAVGIDSIGLPDHVVLAKQMSWYRDLNTECREIVIVVGEARRNCELSFGPNRVVDNYEARDACDFALLHAHERVGHLNAVLNPSILKRTHIEVRAAWLQSTTHTII